MPHETVLDRHVHIESELRLKVPDISPYCDQLPELSKSRVDIGDATIYCEQEGDGPPVVLLHGGPGATHHEFHPAFSRFKQLAKIIYYDQRGCGRSDYSPGGGYSVDQAVDDLHKLRIALKFDRWIVLGHSYGGALAQCYAVKYPEDLSGLILVGSAVAAPVKMKPSRQFEFISSEEKNRIREIYATAELTVQQRIYNNFLNGDWKRQYFYKPTPDDIARIARYEWLHDHNFNRVMSCDMRTRDLRGAFDECPIPTLIIEGSDDLTWNIDKSETLHGILPRAKLVVIDSAGHCPFADNPPAFATVLAEYIRHLSPPTDIQVSSWKDQLGKWRSERKETPATQPPVNTQLCP